MFKREILKTILARIETTQALIQVLSGPRQVGKTTLTRQLQKFLTRWGIKGGESGASPP